MQIHSDTQKCGHEIFAQIYNVKFQLYQEKLRFNSSKNFLVNDLIKRADEFIVTS